MQAISIAGSYCAFVRGKNSDAVQLVSLTERCWAPSGPKQKITALAWSNDETLVCGFQDGSLGVLDVSAGIHRTSWTVAGVTRERPAVLLRLMSPKPSAAVIWDGRDVSTIDIDSNAVTHIAQTQHVSCVAISPNAKVVAVGSSRALTIYRAAKSKVLQPPEPTTAVCFSGNKFLLSLTADALFVWGVDGTAVATITLAAPSAGILLIDGGYACVVEGGTAEIIEIPTSSSVALVPMSQGVRTVAFSDRSVAAWDPLAEAISRATCDDAWNVVVAAGTDDDNALRRALRTEEGPLKVLCDDSVPPEALAELVRALSWAECVALARSCSDLSRSTPARGHRCSLWCRAVLLTHANMALGHAAEIHSAMADVLGHAKTHAASGADGSIRRIHGYLDVVGCASAAQPRDGLTLRSFVESELTLLNGCATANGNGTTPGTPREKKRVKK